MLRLTGTPDNAGVAGSGPAREGLTDRGQGDGPKCQPDCPAHGPFSGDFAYARRSLAVTRSGRTKEVEPEPE